MFNPPVQAPKGSHKLFGQQACVLSLPAAFAPRPPASFRPCKEVLQHAADLQNLGISLSLFQPMVNALALAGRCSVPMLLMGMGAKLDGIFVETMAGTGAGYRQPKASLKGHVDYGHGWRGAQPAKFESLLPPLDSRPSSLSIAKVIRFRDRRCWRHAAAWSSRPRGAAAVGWWPFGPALSLTGAPLGHGPPGAHASHLDSF